MGIDHSDEVGWPAQATDVRLEPRNREQPKALYQAERQKGLGRHARYRERKRLAKALSGG